MTNGDRLHALDAVRGIALLGGVVLHATMSFLPGPASLAAPIKDSSQSGLLALVYYLIHIPRMMTFFLIAGFFARLLLHRDGIRAFVANRARRVIVPFVISWVVFGPLLLLIIAWGTGLPLQAPPSPRGLTLPFPLTYLWFLYFLSLTYVVTLAGRGVFVRLFDRSGAVRTWLDHALRRLLEFPPGILLLAAPVCVGLSSTSGWFWWFGVPTPDISLIPNKASLIAYNLAFLIGWMLHRQTTLLHLLERRWWVYGGIAVVCTLASLQIVGVASAWVPAPRGSIRWLYAGCYALSMWAWTFALLGMALRFLSAASPVRRYIADASYWIYLAHLPLLFFLQVLLRDLPWHWSIKFPLLLMVAFVLLFVSYQYLVRPTVIGAWLNGRKHERPTARLVSAGA